MELIPLIGLICCLATAAAREDSGEHYQMYTEYMSPFRPSSFGIQARDSPSSASNTATEEDASDVIEEAKPRLNAHRMAITKAGYTCGIVGTGEIDPFELGPKFAPPLPTVARSKSKMSKLRRQKMKLLLEKNDSVEVQPDFGITGARGMFRRQRAAGLAPETMVREVAQQNQFCWQVKIRIDFGNGTMKVCGGTIVGARTVLTAAHCLVDRNGQKPISPSVVTVQVGDETSDNGAKRCVEIFSVDVVIPHPSYDLNLEDNDIGLIILSNEIDLVQKPCACKLCMKDKEPLVGEVCVVAGYGQAREQAGSSPASLSWHKQRILRQTFDSRCAFFIGGGQLTALDSFICAGDLDDDQSCTGDDGSQLLCFDVDSDSHYIAGIVSFSAGCGKHIGSQYTRVRKYLNWIEETAPRGDVLVQRGWNREIARQL